MQDNVIEKIIYRDRDKLLLPLFKLKLYFVVLWHALIYVDNTRQQEHLVDQDMLVDKSTAKHVQCSYDGMV